MISAVIVILCLVVVGGALYVADGLIEAMTGASHR